MYDARLKGEETYSIIIVIISHLTRPFTTAATTTTNAGSVILVHPNGSSYEVDHPYAINGSILLCRVLHPLCSPLCCILSIGPSLGHLSKGELEKRKSKGK
jgi:hypothetical protein